MRRTPNFVGKTRRDIANHFDFKFLLENQSSMLSS